MERLRTTEQILFDTIVGKTIMSVKYDGVDATIPEFISETEWRKENGHPFSQTILNKYGKK